jgi:glycosyltransferase involved in cell wall biosynthesis
MKISILLPFKENFVTTHAGAVSLFVNDITKISTYKKNIKIFGFTNYRNYLSNNYINLNFKKRLLRSSNYEYVKSFLNYKDAIKSDLIEVHNRPNYIKFIKKNYKNKLFLYFHNDPIQMNGSKSLNERYELLNSVNKIIFNSEWCRERFFLNFNEKNKFINKTAVCFQSSSKTKINFNNKEKLISFVGKLNKAKGYDLFGNAIVKILNKYPDWKSNVYGDEPREKHIFKHKNLNILGVYDNKIVLKNLEKTSISVICSRWEEPFGRTSLEAASRGSAVIISNKGGLPETTKNALILKKLDSYNIFKTIENLIRDKKKLKILQKKNYKNFYLTHEYVGKLIDNHRKKNLDDSIINLFNIKKKKILKIIHVTNFNRRFSGRLHYNTGRRLNNGFVRLGHNVLTLSDRDILHKNKNILDFNGKKELQNELLKNLENFNADCIVLGHADSISKTTLEQIKNINKNIKICQWFLDPISSKGPDYIKNNNRIIDKVDFLDATFLTTCPSVLKKKIENSYFIPNPSDRSFETLKNYENNCNYDLFFAMSHGVHRGDLKKGKTDKREIFINKLIKLNKNLKYDLYGMNNIQPIWGDKFMNAISKSRMGINLSRGDPVKYYSSDRIAQLLGNGLLTFINDKTYFSDFISDKEIIFYKNIYDLNEKIEKYKKDSKEAKIIAKNGRDTYLKKFNSTIVADYILSKTLDYKSKFKFVWEKK